MGDFQPHRSLVSTPQTILSMWAFQQHTGSPSQPANEHARSPPNPPWVSQTWFWDLHTKPRETQIWQKKRYLCAQRWTPVLWRTVSTRQTVLWVHHHSMVSMVRFTQRDINITQDLQPSITLHLYSHGPRKVSEPTCPAPSNYWAAVCTRMSAGFPSPYCEDVTLCFTLHKWTLPQCSLHSHNELYNNCTRAPASYLFSIFFNFLLF